jgi:hypothetical protein
VTERDPPASGLTRVGDQVGNFLLATISLTIYSFADDLDQAVVPLDDVSVRLGDQSWWSGSPAPDSSGR